jgi:hypothetical protein
MSRNMTRKGLALGSALSLAVAGLTATPAYAVDSLVTNLASGTSYNSVVGYANELKLSTVMSPGLAANETTLHYRISNPSGAILSIGLSNSTTTAVAVVNSGANDGEIWQYGKAAENTTDQDANEAGIQTALTDFIIIPAGNKVGEADDNNFISVGVYDALGATDVSVTVTAWLDTAANANNVQDAVEVTGNTVTLNFYDAANVSATTTLSTPVNGGASLTATTVTTPELNGEQLGADFIDVAFTSQGNSNAVLAENTSSDATADPTMGTTTYSGVTKSWTSTFYLKYSKANDAFNGTDAAAHSITLATVPAQVAFNQGAGANNDGGDETATLTDFTHDLGAVGTWAITLDGINSASITAAQDIGPVTPTLNNATSVTFDVATPGPFNTDATFAAENVAAGTAELWSVGTNATVQAAGVYSATPYIGTTKLGAIASSAGSAVTANDTEAEITGSSSIEYGYNDDASGLEEVKVKTGTTSVSATATVYYTDALDLNKVKTAPAGIPVTVTLDTATGTFTLNGAAVTSDVLYTDANGQVTATVGTTTGSLATNNVNLQFRPQSTAAGNAAGAGFELDWDAPAYELYDLNSAADQPGGNASSYRHINAGGTYTYAFALLDQWGNAADAAAWRLQVVNSGRTVSSDTHALSNGRVNVTVADNAQGAGSTITSTVNVQKLVAGVWTTQATESWDGTGLGTVVINVAAASTESIVFDADGGTLYQSTLNSLTADLSDAVAAVATAAENRRTSYTAQGAYANDVVLNGRVSNALTGVAKGGTFVTLSGPSNVLFSYQNIDSFGSITIPTDAAGDFGVKLFSNTAQKDTVITATTANGAVKTVKVTFAAATARSGRTLAITSSAAEPGMTAVITGTLTDKWGNPVDTDQDATAAAGAAALDATDARLVVSYTGPGLLSGTLPVETGADGTFTVRVLLGSKDSGSLTVTATYGGANGTISAADTYPNIDITTTHTVVIGATAAAPAADTKVNAGSFKGYVAIYAKGHEGKRLSAKVGNDWVVVPALASNFVRVVEYTGAGYTIAVRIYIDRVLVDTITVTTK